MTTSTPTFQDSLALSYAERYGIIDYTVANGLMVYRESFPSEGTYEATVDLSTLKETRRKI